jgi:hypothetical protein
VTAVAETWAPVASSAAATLAPEDVLARERARACAGFYGPDVLVAPDELPPRRA